MVLVSGGLGRVVWRILLDSTGYELIRLNTTCIKKQSALTL